MDNLRPGEGGRDLVVTPISRMMDEERAELRADFINEARTPQPTPLTPLAPGMFRFRTRATALKKRFEIALLIPHVGKDAPGYDDAMERYRRWAQRQMDQKKIPKEEFVGRDKLLRRDVEVFKHLHDYRMRFSPIRKTRECVYTTDNPVVADYIRWRMSLGHVPQVVEDVRPLLITINGVQYPAQITDEAGQRELAKLVASGVDIASLVVQE